MRAHPSVELLRRAALVALCGGLAAIGCDDGDSAEPSADPMADMQADAAVVDAMRPAPDMRVPDAALGVPFCEGGTTHLYAPFESSTLQLFPDDLLTMDADDSPTGVRLAIDPEQFPWMANVPRLLATIFADLDGLSGFATYGAIVMRFSDPIGEVPADAAASVDSNALMLLDLSTTPPTHVPYVVRRSEGDRAIIVQPLRPMRVGTRHALVATTELHDAAGDCIAPGPTMRGLLAEGVEDPRLARMAPRYAEVLDAADLLPEQISAMAVFTTHRETDVMAAVAADIRERAYDWDGDRECEDAENWRQCEGQFEAWDYRDGKAILTPAPKAPWTLPVSTWLPREGQGPWPTIFVGHGLGAGRYQAARLAELYCPAGFAVVAMDAMRHGDHPTSAHGDGQDTALSFLGLNLAGLQIDGQTLVGNFNQTVVDRLQ
ncbi:MAG: hypothetical protein KC620_07550, partial [Myxococcales bacterium]|nr:hypothetical protein [Myxococcales bacterium]